MKHLRALLVNPFIYDFAAYGFWSSPLGLLYLGSILRQNGITVDLIDCLRVVEEKRKKDGRAPFIQERAELPQGIARIRKRYRRYGISKETLLGELALLESPDLVLVTSIMTYWYPGTREVLSAIREVFPEARIILGGIYPSLCYEHASVSMSNADLIVRNNEIARLYTFIEEILSFPLPFKPSLYDFEALPRPCYDLYDTIPFVALLSSYGCSYKCTYCATRYMHPAIIRRKPAGIVEEVFRWAEDGVRRFVLYDDNFLYQKDAYAKPILRALSKLPFDLEFYNPNALNAALIDEETAYLLAAARFKEVRMGLETTDNFLQKSTGGKVDSRTFDSAVQNLLAAGFSREAVKAYILAGLPMQPHEDVEAALHYCRSLDVTPHIAEYTPIPHTAMFDRYREMARYPIAEEPIYQNNAFFPFAWEGFTEKDLARLKLLAGSGRT